MFLPDSLVPAFCSKDSMRPAKAMRNEGVSSCGTWGWQTHTKHPAHRSTSIRTHSSYVHEVFRAGETWGSGGLSQRCRRIRSSWHSSDVIRATSTNLFYHSVRGREDKGCHLLTSVLFIIVWSLLEDYSPFPLLEAPHLVLFWFQVQWWNLSFQGNSHSFLNPGVWASGSRSCNDVLQWSF